MEVAIMQPYFFPYLGYFQLIHSAERFVFFDTPQYERRSWMNRNRIINPSGEFTYISVPIIKAPQKTPINAIEIDNREDWKSHLMAQLEIYKKKAPYYADTAAFVRSVLDEAGSSLSELSIASVVRTCEYLGLKRNWSVFSKMGLDIRQDCEPDEWALEISKAISAQTYINVEAGRSFFNEDKYTQAGIKLLFLKPGLPPYTQRIGRFVQGLSIIDVMMFNPPEAIRPMLEEYTLFEKGPQTDEACEE